MLRLSSPPSFSPLLTRILQDVVLINYGLAICSALLWIFAGQRLGWVDNADFTAYYTGISILRKESARDIYNFNAQTVMQDQVLEGVTYRFADNLLPFDNPPYITLILYPLSFLTRHAAYWIWALVQFGILIWIIRSLLKVTKSWSGLERHILISTFLVFPPLLINFVMGAFSLIIFAGFLQFYISLKGNKEIQAGLWFLPGLIKPQLVILQGVMLLAYHRWKSLLVIFISVLFTAAVTTLFLGWPIWTEYLSFMRELLGNINHFGIYPARMYSIRSTLFLALGDQYQYLLNSLSIALLFLAVLGILILWWRARSPENNRIEMLLALTFLALLITSPHLNFHDALAYFLPMMLIFVYLIDRQSLSARFLAFFCSAPYVFLLVNSFGTSVIGAQIIVAMMILFAVWVIRLILNHKQDQVEAFIEA